MERSIAERGRFPAINVLKSDQPDHARLPDAAGARDRASCARQALSAYSNMEELIRIGAYRAGADPLIDRAIRLNPAVEAFLSQRPGRGHQPRRQLRLPRPHPAERSRVMTKWADS